MKYFDWFGGTYQGVRQTAYPWKVKRDFIAELVFAQKNWYLNIWKNHNRISDIKIVDEVTLPILSPSENNVEAAISAANTYLSLKGFTPESTD